jgi:hypothetical protein
MICILTEVLLESSNEKERVGWACSTFCKEVKCIRNFNRKKTWVEETY